MSWLPVWLLAIYGHTMYSHNMSWNESHNLKIACWCRPGHEREVPDWGSTCCSVWLHLYSVVVQPVIWPRSCITIDFESLIPWILLCVCSIRICVCGDVYKHVIACSSCALSCCSVAYDIICMCAIMEYLFSSLAQFSLCCYSIQMASPVKKGPS